MLVPQLLKALRLKIFALAGPVFITWAMALPAYGQINPGPPPAGSRQGSSLTVRSDIQEADARTGIITARGNVQLNYAARGIQATAAQAQYFSRERRIVLSGDVFILQEGNTIRGETVTYLIDEGRFIALPENQGQVESIYLVPASEADAAGNAIGAPFNPKPAFKTPISP